MPALEQHDIEAINQYVRDAILETLDRCAEELSLADGSDKGKGATDQDLPQLFRGIDAQVERILSRTSTSNAKRAAALIRQDSPLPQYVESAAQDAHSKMISAHATLNGLRVHGFIDQDTLQSLGLLNQAISKLYKTAHPKK